ncbi:MAG TPA: hypothetical protein VKA70_16525 [Blastocatellia bacterium]|nr:hypothetical protein [Blastocatellia bacterium]
MQQYLDDGADILVRSPDNDIKLIVEVKARNQSSPEWAAKFRHNLIANHVLPKSRFFLLALPDFLYLWRDGDSSEVVPPDYTVRTVNLLLKYLTRLGEEPKYIGEEGLQLALTSWLRDATFSSKRPPVGSDSYRFLVESGLLDAISKAEVSAQPHL